MCGGTIIKILIGALVMIASVWWILQGSFTLFGMNFVTRADLISLLNGGVPILVFLIGLFVVWLELDELRIERELKSEKKKK